MSGDPQDESKITELSEFKERREHKLGHEAFDRGEAFKFVPFELDDGELPNGVGQIEDTDHPVVFFTDKESLEGICFTVKTARRIAEDLISVCNEIEYGPRGPQEKEPSNES